MAQDSLPPPPPTAIEPPPLASPFRPSRFVIAGAFGACVLGVGLGLWARPTSPAPPQLAVAKPAPPTLQVVVDDRPAPAGPLLEVLPADVTPADRARAVARLIPVEPLAAGAAGLVRVDAVIAPAPNPALAGPKLADRREPPPAPKAVETVVARPKARPAPPTRVAGAAPEPAQAKPAKAVKLARAEPKPRARAEASPPRRTVVAKPEKSLAKAAAGRKKPIQQADAKARPAKAKVVKVAAKAETARLQKAKLQKGTAEKAKIQKAKAEPARKAKPTMTKAKVAKASPPRTVPPTPRRIAPRGEGPMRVARADRCAAADPGEALVCADRRLAARDRQLQQAYRDAEAAGVPASALRRQQTRWVQARAAAAREAPWAVEDVYVARISELHDLSRDAREN